MAGALDFSKLGTPVDSLDFSRGGIPADIADGRVKPSATVGDVAKSFGAGALEGTGYIFKGLGDAVSAGLNYVGEKAGVVDPNGPRLRSANPLEAASEYLRGKITPGGAIAMEESTPVGDITSPSTWGFKGKPSVSGTVANVGNVLGQFVPNLGIALATGGTSIPAQLATGAVVGGAQAYGAASEEEAKRILEMRPDELALIPGFQALLAQGIDPLSAQQMLAERAGIGGGLGSGIPSALEGALENVLIPALTRGRVRLPGGSRATRAGVGAGAGFVTGGAEEAGEKMAQTYGTNLATGEGRSVTHDTFGEALYGGIGEGVIGGGLGALSRGRAPAPRDVLLSEAADMVRRSEATTTAASAAETPPATDREAAQRGATSVLDGLKESARRREEEARPPPSMQQQAGFAAERDNLLALSKRETLAPEVSQSLVDQKLARVDPDGSLRILPAGRRRLKELSSLGQGDGTRDAPVKVTSSADVEAAATRAKEDYTPEQGEANNIQRAHVDWDGLQGTLEVAAGGERRGTNPATGEAWATTHSVPYGYWKGTKGADGMHVDAYWGPELEKGHPVYVLDEVDEKGDFRQHKSMVGFPSAEAARAAYLGTSSKKPEHIGAITPMPVEQFKTWVKDEAQTTKPVAYKKGAVTDVTKRDAVTPVTDGAAHDLDFKGAMQGADVAGDFYRKAFDALNGKRNTVSRMKDPILGRAKPAFDAGLIKTVDDLRRFENEGYPTVSATAAKKPTKPTKPTAAPDVPTAPAREGEILPADNRPFLERVDELMARTGKGENVNVTEEMRKLSETTGHGYGPEGPPRDTTQTIDAEAEREPNEPKALPAPVQQLYVEHAGKRYPVDSLHDASQKWSAARMASIRQGEGGASQIGNGVRVVDQDGKEVARISYNGRVWPPGESKPGAIPLLEADGSPGKSNEQRLAENDAAVKAQETVNEPKQLPAADEPAQRAEQEKPAAEAQATDEEARVLKPKKKPKLPAERRAEKAARDAAAASGGVPILEAKPERKPLHTSTNKSDGLEAEVWPHESGGFSVVLHDTDADANASSIKIFPADQKDAAIAYARELVRPKDGAATMPGEPAQPKEPDAAPAFGESNKVFTKDAAAAARERLRKKLGTARSGLDPEMLVDGATLAGYYIEGGARKFADYAAKMVEDLGEGVRPYLRAFYESVRHWPGFDAQGMSTAKEIAEAEKPAEIAQDVASPPLTEQTESEATDERTRPGEQGSETLGEAPAQADGATEGRGDVRAGDDGGSPSGAEGNRAPDEPGVSTPRGGGSGASTVHPAARGARGRRSGARIGRNGSRVSKEGGAEPVASAPNVPAQNFTITDEVRLGQGAELEKFRDNIAAITALKTIERENRRATPEEQRNLVRYVGWGGLANAFADTEGNFKDGWAARGKELAELLTPSELAAARRSTRNAHYTSEPVVRGMWTIAERLGFRGGLALETSAGSGNFIGLEPDALRGATRFIAVEYDSLTARIAQALYPQETVLHSGFQKVPLADGAFDLSIGNPPFGSESLRFQFKPELNGASIHNQFFRAAVDALKPGGLHVAVVSHYLLDAKDDSSRLALAGKAKLIGAIRLPDTTFRENARTDVVTDVVILQRLTPAEEAEVEKAIDARKRRPEKERDAERARRALAAQVPEWVDTTEITDPLGGEAMTVNTYFSQNPHMVVGRLERSGKMQFGTDAAGNKQGGLNVKLQPGQDFQALLDQVIDTLPRNVLDQQGDVIEASMGRHRSMSAALRIAISGKEAGHIEKDADGNLTQIVERETPEGDFELTKRKLTSESPWSQQLLMDRDGRWYKLEVKTDEKGKPVKVLNAEGQPTKRNVYARVVYQNESDVPGNMRLGKKFEPLTKLADLRDLLSRQLTLEAENATQADMEGNRKKLSKAYHAFVAEYGHINDPKNAALVSEMPDGALVLALELSFRPALTAEKAKKTGEKPRPASVKVAPILTQRVVVPYAPPGKADSPSDALAITLAERGRVDMARIASLLDTTEESAAAQLQQGTPLVFKDPETGGWETRDAYLSGQVKRKLNAAKAAGLALNVEALEKVQPQPWTAEQVSVHIGGGWVPAEVYEGFIKHLTGASGIVRYSEITNAFHVTVADQTSAKAKEWSTDEVSVQTLVSDLLNSKSTRVTWVDADGRTHLAPEATAIALLKARQIATEFSDWVFTDGARRQQLVDIFNEKFNTRVNRQHNGQHLKLPGKVPDEVIRMRRHQMNVIWRGISERFLLIDHVVGAGKTFTAIARAMERRRMGLSRKPMIVVPNHLVEQFSADVYRLYPGAKVLAAGKKDFEKSRRRKIFAKIATGDWDIVVVPHSSFGFIGISPETEQRFLEEELRIANAAIKEAEEQAAEDGNTGWRKPFNVKEAERLAEKIQNRLDNLKSRKHDRLLTFEQMGVDDLTVDEVHEFKNLFYSSRLTGVRGMGDKGGSQKAFDLYNKVRVLTESPTGTFTGMSGTPISNSAVEMYTMMRYFAAKELKELGLEHFDAWRAQFVEATPAYEPTEWGTLKEVTRLGRSWSNMRSLMNLYYAFTDAVTQEDIKQWYAEDNPGKEFPVPKVKGGDRQRVIVQPTEAQQAMLKGVLEDYKGLDAIDDPYERNAARLRLMDRARKLSLDARAVDPRTQTDEKDGKLERISAEVKRIYERWTKEKGTQLIFLDRSIPRGKDDHKTIKEYDALVAARDKALRDNDEEGYRGAVEKLERFDPNEIQELRNAQAGGWNAYEQLKQNLIGLGIPAGEIRFIQEANNDAQKQAIFDAVNDGRVRVLIGSTQRMGAGTNVQERLVGLHHADVTWKPSDIEQREGRIIRQGNLIGFDEKGNVRRPDFEVEIIAYATERTMDAKMWDLNASKLRTINGIRKYDGSFTMDFEDEEAVGIAEIAALASGDPLLLERVKLMSEIDKLDLQRRAFNRKQYALKDAIDAAEKWLNEGPGNIDRLRARGARLTAALEVVDVSHSRRRVTIEGKVYDTRFDAMKAALEAIDAKQAGDEKARYSVEVDGKQYTSKAAIEDAVQAVMGDAVPFEMEVNGALLISRSDAVREILGPVNKAMAGLKKKGDKQAIDLGTWFGMKMEATAGSSEWSGNFYVGLSLTDAAGDVIASVDSNMQDTAKIAPPTVHAVLRHVEDGVRAAANPAAQVSYMEGKVRAAGEELPGLKEKVGQTFPLEDEVREKQARLAEVTRLLSSGPSGPMLDKALLDAALTDQQKTDIANDADVEEWGDEAAEYMIRSYAEWASHDKPTDIGPHRLALYQAIETALKAKPAMRRGAGGGMDADTVEAQTALLMEGWKNPPKIVVTADPAAWNIGAPADAKGAHWRDTVYLASSALADHADVRETFMHETTHFAISIMPEAGSALQHVWAVNPKIRRATAQWIAANQDVIKKQRLTAPQAKLRGIDEALATLAGRGEKVNGFQRILAVIQKWLRKHNWGNVADWLEAKSDAEVLSLLAEARRFVEHGDPRRFHVLTAATGAFARPAPLWTSGLLDFIEAKAPGTAPATQWATLLEGWAKQGKFKADELEWSGLKDWLAAQGGRVAKADVITYLNENGVQVTETVLGGDVAVILKGRRRVEDLNEEGPAYVYDIEGVANLEPYIRILPDGRFEVPMMDDVLTFNDIVLAERELANFYANEADLDRGNATRYGRYTLPGGENYRELLLTLPNFGDGGPADWVPGIGRVTRPHPEARQAPAFRSSHFDQPNILAHVRFNERTDAEGKRVLFIEEVQSDWAQKGRRIGFTVNDLPPGFKTHDKGNGRWTIVSDEGIHLDYAAGDSEAEALRNHFAMINGARVSRAPFVEKTEQWTALALKRMIRWAAENGFDRVAWATGEQQTDRYDLSKRIGMLSWAKLADGDYSISASGPRGGDVPGLRNKRVAKNELADTIGKDLADRIIGSPDKSGRFEGLDLRVGGEGMRSFYDKILPNVANDVLKKLGGGRVGEVGLGRVERGVLMSDHPYLRQPGFDITPALRERVMGGLPAFSRTSDLALERGGELAQRARDELGNLFTSSRTFNRAWHRTIGTQFHKATIDRDYKRVFDIGQEYLTDTSRYSMQAEGEAPSLLLRMEGVKDIFKGRISAKDAEAIATPIFEGTLRDERVYSDEDLRGRFNLTDKQIGYYKEFRAATDKSIDDLTKSTLGKMARAIGVHRNLVDGLRKRETTLDEFHREVQEAMKDRAKVLADLAESETVQIRKADLTHKAKLAKEQVAETSKVYNRIVKLKRQGYAPLMRFGEYTVDVVNGEGEREFFGMYESQRAANAAAKLLAQEFPDAEVTQGVMSQEGNRVFQGLSPETVELFAKHLGLDENPMFQAYLKLAVNNRSALRRLIKRHGIAGYSEDVTRVLAAFVTSNARLTSANYHLGDMQAAVDRIPKAKGDVKDEAEKLRRYLTDPQEEAAALRGFLFFNFLGGSVASAIVNATQPVTMTAPYLTQFASAASVASQLAKAAKEASTNATPADLRTEYKRALEEGIVAPHEIHQLMAEARGGLTRNIWLAKGLRAWGAFFSLAEAFNRRTTFIAAYRIGLENELTRVQAYEFAKNAVIETQGLYNKGNRPNWARGAIGATVFTFKQFSISYIEFLKRLPNKQRLIALAILFLAAGIEGLPFAEDIEDVIDTIGQWMGHATNTKKWLRENALELFGETGGDYVRRGVSAVLPLDVHQRLGMQNLIPGTSALKLSETDRGDEALEVLGPAGGVVKGAGKALTSLGRGQPGEAAKAALPTAIQNAFKGMEMWETGVYKDGRGRKVMDVDTLDAFVKGVGFQPADVARESAKIGQNLQDINLVKTVESSLVERWARAVVEDEREKIADVRAELVEWNATNPALPIRIKPEQIRQRIAEMRKTREERTLKTAPKEIRSSLR